MPNFLKDRLTGKTRGALLLIAAINMLNIVDRKIVAILAEPIKRDLALSDGEVGLLTGFTFSVVYALCAVPVARIADGGDRVSVLATALALWSAATGACALAVGFWWFLLARMLVAAGESACTPASYSLISDYVPARHRAKAMATSSVAIALGTLLAFAVGGHIAQTLNWRFALLIVGLPGFLVAIVVWKRLPEPRREAASAQVEEPLPADNLMTAIATLLRNPVYVLLIFSGATFMFSLNALMIWSASLLQRSFGWTIGESGLVLGLVFGFTGIASPLLTAWLADHRASHDRGGNAFIMGVLGLIAAPILVAGVIAPSAAVSLGMIAVVYLLSSGWSPLVLSAIRSLTSSRQMALAIAVLGVVHNLVGMGLGPLVIGMLSDRLQPIYGPDAIRYALLPAAAMYLPGAIFLFIAAKLMRREQRD